MMLGPPPAVAGPSLPSLRRPTPCATTATVAPEAAVQATGAEPITPDRQSSHTSRTAALPGSTAVTSSLLSSIARSGPHLPQTAGS